MGTYRVVVTTSDKYLPALRPFAYLFNKYWSDEQDVLVMGFTPPSFSLPPNFAFMSLGDFNDYPVNKWTDAVIRGLEYIDDDVFVLMLEDYWLTRPVDKRSVQILVDYMRQFNYVAKMDLCGDRLYAHGADLNYGHVGHIDLVKSMPGSPYHMSLMTGAWNRRHLLRHLRPGWSPWDVEIVGTTNLSHDQDVIVLGTRQWPVRHTLAFRSGDSSTLKLDELATEDIVELNKYCLLDAWRKDEE